MVVIASICKDCNPLHYTDASNSSLVFLEAVETCLQLDAGLSAPWRGPCGGQRSPVAAGDLVVFDVAEVTCNIQPLLEGLGDSLVDVVHGGRPRMVQPLLKFGGVSLLLTHTGSQ